MRTTGKRAYRVQFQQAWVIDAADALDAVRQVEAAGTGEAIEVRALGPSQAYSLVDRAERVALADLELDEVRRRLAAELSAVRPELFDRRGRLRKGLVAQVAAQRAGGRREVSAQAVVGLGPADHKGTTGEQGADAL